MMKVFFLFLINIPLLLNFAFADDNYTLTGTVLDGESQEKMAGVAIYLKDLGKGTTTDTEGFFAIGLPHGTYSVTFSFIGYEMHEVVVVLVGDQKLNIALNPLPIHTDEIIVKEIRNNENIVKYVDKIAITQSEIRQLPYLLGQVDPIKMLQLLPGIQSNGEGNNGIFVRGGGIDQNLILLDHAPVYNSGHLFGFFSLFNHTVIKEVNLLKGGIPASYGGRLASVLEVNTRSGDFNKFKGEGNIGMVSANITLEGPIVKKKSSFIMSGRRTYLDILSKLTTNHPTIFNTGINYFFDDLNGRLDFKLTPKDKLALSAYSGTDDFQFLGKNTFENTIKWKNHTASLLWDHFYNDKNYMSTSFFISKYRMDFSAAISEYVFNIHSAIQDYGVKTQWNIGSLNRHRLTFGVEYIHHALIPNNIKASGNSVALKFTEQEQLPSQEQALFINDEFKISNRFSVQGGARLSFFQQLGPFTRFQSDESLTIQDTIHFEKNKIIQHYRNFDPRLTIIYASGKNSSIKASFDRMHQYLHMAPVSSVSLPTDVWVSSSSKIKPQQGTQYSLGYFRNFMDNEIETSATAYYKEMNNQIEYREGVIVGYSKGHNYDDSFIFGRGRSYGLEFFIKKNHKTWTGWLSYTLSKTTRTFDEINYGKTFAAKYDRLHNFSWVNNYDLNRRWSFSTVFTYATGNAMTLPVGRYIINGNIINEYEGRNTFRMPPYHRMDVSATYKFLSKRKLDSYLIFSVYNLYNRKNPYYIYYETKGNVNEYSLETKLKKVSLFPVIPSIAYQFEF